jgi:hypothetical protein
MALWNKNIISTTVFILQQLNNKGTNQSDSKTGTFVANIHITKLNLRQQYYGNQ